MRANTKRIRLTIELNTRNRWREEAMMAVKAETKRKGLTIKMNTKDR
jgi:hypothetical protein